jgi:predicted RNA methylase
MLSEQKKAVKAKENQRTQKFNKNLKLGTIRLAASLLEEQKRRLEEEEAADLAAGGGGAATAATGASPVATPGRKPKQLSILTKTSSSGCSHRLGRGS